ncbi:trypsin-like [Topomyia yanbarensis]|uniref:trypsin-like n=1 Tax=Topomyia yanbarensis TaxID=2498891 RepID=UPI00273CB652|nr:trypsin-like [Topomyia yanbarensis]
MSRLLSVLLLVTTLVVVVVMVTASRDPEPFLLGGAVTQFGEYPAVAHIVTPDHVICGAAVVDDRHVVTLAQCVLNGTHHSFNPRLIRINTGDIRLMPVSSTRQTSLGAVIYVHPNYKAHTLENDIAVIRVQVPFRLPSNEVEPAIRRTRIVANGVTCQMPGWGVTAAAGNVINAEQRYIAIPINDRDVCNSVRPFSRVFESMICAGNMVAAQNGPAPCPQSIGSGLYCNGELTGLLSFGLNCGAANNPPTFTQVRFFNPWINQTLLRTDIPPAGWSPLDV